MNNNKEKQQPEFTEDVSGAMIHPKPYFQPEQVETVENPLLTVIQKCRNAFEKGNFDIADCVLRGYQLAQWQSQQQAARIAELEQQVNEFKSKVEALVCELDEQGILDNAKDAKQEALNLINKFL